MLAACGGTADTTTTRASDAAAEPTTTGGPEPPPPTATSPTSTTATTGLTTTTEPATTTSVSTNELASGSGCTPGTDDLPDGRWFGFATGTTGTSIGFDLACWFSDEAATLAAAEDGEESPPPNDYHIRNANALIRTVPVTEGAEVIWMRNPGDPATVETISFTVWVADREARQYQPGIWIDVADGSVSSVEEQYVP